MNMPEITQKNFRALLPCKIATVIEKIGNEKGISSKEALLIFYASDVYRELEIEETKYWWESPAQLYRDLLLPNLTRGNVPPVASTVRKTQGMSHASVGGT